MLRLSTASAHYQNKGGYVYLLKVRNESNLYKIGRSRVPHNRLKTFNVKLPFPVELIALIKTDNMYSLEKMLHRRFDHKRSEGEFFYLTTEDVQSICALQGNTLNGNPDIPTARRSQASTNQIQAENERLRKRNLELEADMEALKESFSKAMYAAQREVYENRFEIDLLKKLNKEMQQKQSLLFRELGRLEVRLEKYETQKGKDDDTG